MKFQNAYSVVVDFELGAPQGSVLSPFLFNVIMNEILQIESANTDKLSFADDLAYLIIGKFNLRSKIKRVLKESERLFIKYGLKVNFEKTKIIIFGQKNRQSYYLFDTEIKKVRQYCYFGCYF